MRARHWGQCKLHDTYALNPQPMSPGQAILRYGSEVLRVPVRAGGESLRRLLLDVGFTPYNGGANALNCRGLGTCGTCAVQVQVQGHGNTHQPGCSPPGVRERARLSLPPHRGAGESLRRGLRLACQCVVMPGADVAVDKPSGFWGQGERRGITTSVDMETSTGDVAASTLADGSESFDFAAIRALAPMAPWLLKEMRSNHAGETGAVQIYAGALWGLELRKRVGLRGDAKYEDEAADFCAHHAASERAHLVALNQVLPRPDRSIMLPAWRVAGFVLGSVSTAWCPRGIYVTTDAVETFVEAHYKAQIERLEAESDAERQVVGETSQAVPGAKGKAELLRMLRWACEDEVAHKEEAQQRSLDPRGGQPWFGWVDPAWQWLVGKGSAAAAGLARRL